MTWREQDIGHVKRKSALITTMEQDFKNYIYQSAALNQVNKIVLEWESAGEILLMQMA